MRSILKRQTTVVRHEDGCMETGSIHLDTPTFERILEIAATSPVVHQDVEDNYWNNRWWPLEIKDWRLKILFAGLSTRVSYNAIGVYQTVRDHLASYGFSGLLSISEETYKGIVRPLGLAETRWKFWQSVRDFALRFPDPDGEPQELRRLNSAELIEFLNAEIRGVGYKVAQGSALYIRGYHSGIIPVDSGMKDILGPCLGFQTARGPRGHEFMRKNLENLAQKIDYGTLLTITGYEHILEEMRPGQLNTWWVHLVLIYFKRRFCNLHDMTLCPIAKVASISDQMMFTCVESKNDRNS